MEQSHMVGRRLRKIRMQNSLSLKDVEKSTKGHVKASILGAYERGERVISIPRLYELAEFFNVPVDYLITNGSGEAEETQRGASDKAGGIKIDLVSLNKLPEKDVSLLKNYISGIRKQREDFNVEVITIREDDLKMLAALYGTDTESVSTKLKKLNLVAS
ncbi:hypothetical protein LCGC14_2573640 [marine sediment metagenome]|uniref:HTH cro/C1-type domain-containing protein n=1 Tax=marine sediment metagenome TaxID=412755 RepID=A0A0F9CSQ4_9ZZZZ